MINSLRGRLFISLTAVILLTGLIGGVFAHRWAFDEAIETQDSVLIQIAGLVQSGGFTGTRDLHGVDEDSEVWLMELGKAPQGTPEERELWRLQDGLRDATRKGRPVRLVLRTRPDGSRFAVAQSTGVRDEIAGDMALRTVLPIAALIPCLMLVIAFVIAGSLRPMVRLAGELDARRADDTTALSLRGLPGELNPFVSSINGLLQRLQEMIGQQRRFIADAAHELRTPLTALSLQAENLDQIELPVAARERLATLRQGMRRSKHLLEQLLTLARHDAVPSEAAQWEVVELDRAARGVIADLLQEAINRGVDLGFERAETVQVRGEPVMLAAMIRNLVDNALRFTPRGGRIDIAIYQDGAMAGLEIEDNGPGLRPRRSAVSSSRSSAGNVRKARAPALVFRSSSGSSTGSVDRLKRRT